jgi:hypothetical protein
MYLENQYRAQAWFGEGVDDSTVQAPPSPDGYLLDIMIGASAYSKRSVASLSGTAPGGGAEENWSLRFRQFGEASYTATLWVPEWENADHAFVPQDYSVVVVVGATRKNLRVENAIIDMSGGAVTGTLVVDNAVNIQSIENLTPLVGNAGDPVTLRITVKNTGRYTDTYSVSVVGGPDYSTGPLAPGATHTGTLVAALPVGTNVPIWIQAAGSYARDTDSILATGVQPIVLKGYDSAYSLNRAGILPWVPYDNDPTTPTPGSPPAMVAKKVGSGSVIAAGIAATCRGAPGITMRWVLGELNVLMENMFKWMTSGTNVLWFEDNRVYYMNQERGCRYLTDNLRARGYTIDGLADNTVTVPITDTLLSGYDIFVLPQLQIGDRYLGGDPDLLSDAEVQAIKSFVQNGGGLLITESADYGGYNYARVGNKILHELGFGWWFQHDQLTDNIHKVTYDYQPVVLAEDTNDIGSAYRAATGKENIRLYNACTLIPEPTLSATVAAPDQKAKEGTSIVVPITITNLSVGAVWDNYFLWVEDTKGWTDNDNLSVRDIRLDNGASTVVNLTVNIPFGALSAVDTVRVYARSFSGYGSSPLIFSGTFKVTSVPAVLAGVDVEIIEDNGTAHCSVVSTLINPSYRYDPLTFTVEVWNFGMLDDKYELTAWMESSTPEDIENVGLKLTPDELFVPSGDKEYASLSVTIPESWWAGYSGVVIVKAVGMMSSENQEPKEPTDNDTVLVIAGENAAVKIEIMPDNLEPQSGAPGSELVWLVVVKNIGNKRDTFNLTPSDVCRNVSRDTTSHGEGDSWNAALDDNSFQLNPSDKGVTKLRVTVPIDSHTSEWDIITVTVTGAVTGVTDNYTVKAHVLEPGPRIPEGVIEIAVEAEVIAIYVHPTTYDFGVMDEHKVKSTPGDNYFKVRNTGNVPENILVRGTDAQSMPGEPVTTWKLDNQSTGVDQYMLRLDPLGIMLSKVGQTVWSYVDPGHERYFGLTIYTPTAITTPARMWARVKLVAVKA